MIVLVRDEVILVNNCYLQSIAVSNFGPFTEELMFTTEVGKTKKESENNSIFMGANGKKFNKVSFVF